MIFGKKDWFKEKRKLLSTIGTFAVIDWIDLDKLMGTNVKKIYIYNGEYIVDERPYNEVEVKYLKKFMPVVDLTRGRPYPEDFEKIPKFWKVFGRLNLADLGV